MGNACAVSKVPNKQKTDNDVKILHQASRESSARFLSDDKKRLKVRVGPLDKLKVLQSARREQDGRRWAQRVYKSNSDVMKDNRIAELKKENETLRTENTARAFQCQQAEYELGINRKEIQRLTKECDEFKTRLSKMASDRLTDNNPNIADLSDENRAIKVGEKFSELYSNEWCDAFEELTENGKRTESEAVKLLLNILINVHKECAGEADRILKDLKEAILKFTGNTELNQLLSLSLKTYKDQRKKTYQNTLPSLDQMISACIPSGEDRTGTLRTYVRSATEICWLMCIQDPPISLHLCKRKGSFNGNYFSPYTVTGKYVEYLVWPALLLHESGPLMQKGVAQGMMSKRKKKKIKSTAAPNKHQCIPQSKVENRQQDTLPSEVDKKSSESGTFDDGAFHNDSGKAPYDEKNGLTARERRGLKQAETDVERANFPIMIQVNAHK